ncbi:MAG TPA: ATP-binding protein, partial [Clostridia bacterium]|nr:ATP-binding protein [Clostridia bacterium]
VWRGELVNKRKDGSLYTEEMTITPVTDLAGEITHFIAAKQDISERKHVEQTILRQNQRLSILNAAAEALLSATNAEAALAVIYDRMAEYFGIDGFIEFHLNSAGDALELVASKAVAEARQPSITRLQLGQGIAGKVAQTRRPILVANAQASSDPALQFVKELGAHAYACEPLIIGDRLLGTLSFSSCRRENFDDEDQDFFRTLANYIALAKERLRLNEELQQHASRLEQTVRDRTAQLIEANANLQTFAYTAAHDLRSPLRSIRNFSSLAVEDFGPQLGSEGKFYLEKVAQSADQMAKLLNDLLEYSKIIQIELRLEKVQLAKAIEEALVLLQDDIQNTGAEISVVEPMPAVLGHSATITLIIANFVANALKFMPAGILPKVRIWAEPAGGLIRLWVQDNGIGIEPQDRQKLFQLFQRLHGKGAYPGTGLGLAIVRRAVERMGGHVGVESEKGKGSRFWAEFKLPEDGTA